MTTTDEEPDIGEAITYIDELITELLPTVSVEVQPAEQRVNISGVYTANNGGDGIHIENSPDFDNIDIDVQAHYEVVGELSEVAKLIESGPEENRSKIMDKLENLNEILGGPAKLAKIAVALGFA